MNEKKSRKGWSIHLSLGRGTSISAMAKLDIALILMLFVVQTAIVAACLVSVDRTLERFNNTWLTSAGLLSDVGGRFTSFRLAEAELAMPTTAAMRNEAAAELREHRSAIDALLARYSAVSDAREQADVDALRASLAAYFAAHDGGFGDPNAPHALTPAAAHLLSDRYEAVERAVQQVTRANRAAARAEAARADRLVDVTLLAALALGIGALVFGTLMMRHVQHAVLGPMLQITGSLVRLAQGEEMPAMPGTQRRDEIGAMAKAFDVFREKAAELKAAHEATRAAQEQAQMLARHDPLTGLPNRRLLSSELRAAVRESERRRARYLVLVMDLDRFKPVNDLYGHSAGDAVLCEVANRLRRAVRDTDTVARLGGDEFAVVARVQKKEPVDAARELATRILAAIRVPIFVTNVRVEVDASIGIACLPRDGTTPDDLLRAADIAMYRAKQEGKSTYRFFEQQMDDDLRAQAALESDLRRALLNGDIVPHYQPIVRFVDDAITGFEILARWHHPVRGWVPPDTFIPIIEQMGMMTAFTARLMRTACRDALAWPGEPYLALNISPAQLADQQLAAQLLPILADEGFPPSRLEIEITESALMSDLDTARGVLADFRRAGVRMSLDDFGTGYSSLQHLRELRFDKVKIDRSFVLSMLERDETAKIVDAIVALSANLGMATVAEGVETRELERALRKKGCQFGQGYLFGKAMPSRDVDALFAASHGGAAASVANGQPG
ncbi:MAG TPA: EAL domain-containing protein [Paraburkholderia sp.]|jgi:diguanylate cyclase (GGDEF)-like protein|nr:EAL domain-containing protein [Paraburkholderia sp.]